MRTAARSLLLVAVLIVVVTGAVWSTRTARPSASLAPSLSQGPALAAQSSQGLPFNTDLFRNIARQENPVAVAIMTRARGER